MTKLFNRFLENVVALRRQDPLFGDVFTSIYEIFKEQNSNYQNISNMMKILITTNGCIFILLILERSPK